MKSWLEALAGASAAAPDTFRPVLFRPTVADDRARLEDLLKRDPRLTVHDTLMAQVRELVKALHPSEKLSPEALHDAALAHLNGCAPEDYGVWAYYPWSHRLVHLLDEAEFALVRTDRNRNKITREEQAVLATKRVGIIGLSVGSSAALALTMERSFGELRLADFDTLDLSNLNRIRSGVHHLGVSKVVNTAREIAEIDPFLRIIPFHSGIQEANIEQFLLEGGALDLLIEECDSVAVKIMARQHAKAHRIPVLMDTSDRGLIDVERFDLEPERPILHGLVDHLDLSLAAHARTNEEKLPFVVPIIGLDSMSTRMKASMLEIESTVGTWPQLASSVVLGGALVADIHRRMALGQITASGRWYVDSETLIADPQAPKRSAKSDSDPEKELTATVMERLAEGIIPAEAHRPITAAQAESLVQAAIAAPSAGNLQPWSFMLHGGRLFVFHDGAKGDSGLDSGRLIPALDMGTCLENIRLRAAEDGLGLRLQPYPFANDHRLVAVIEATRSPITADPLSNQIHQRCTNRRKGDSGPLPDEAIEAMMAAAAHVNGCAAHVLTDRASLMGAAELIAEAERIRVLNPIGHHELFQKEIRWSAAEASGRDGIDLPSMELKATEEVAFRVARDREAMNLLREWNGGQGFKRMTRDNLRSASGLVLISTSDGSREGLLAAGRAMQRVWLSATSCQLAVHPCAAPILLAHHVRHGNGAGLTSDHQQTLLRLGDQLADLFALEGKEPVFMMRLSHAPPPTSRSLRRPVSAFLHHSQQPVTA